MPDTRAAGGSAATEEISVRILTFRYLAALAILAMIAVASHVSFTRVLRENGGSTYLNVVSGQQQALVQLVARHAVQYANGDATALGKLRQETALLADSHTELLARMRDGELPEPVIAALHSVYDGPAGLKSELDIYIAAAQRVAQSDAGAAVMDADVNVLLRGADGPVHEGFRQLVGIYDDYTMEQVTRLERMQNYMLAMMFITLALEACIIFNPMVQRIMRYTTDLLKLASTDPLTGLLNRRSFMDRAFTEVRRARRENRPSCLMTIDADHFKRINDTHGHGIGDTVLKAMAESLAARIRQSDLLGRIGGEEFAVLLPGMTLEAAEKLAERLRGDVAGLAVPTDAGPVGFTISIGVTLVRGDEAALAAALGRADKALYAAKAEGRNRVKVFTGADEAVQIAS